MTTITPQMVKELRELTGAGMGDCKKALDNSAGNIENAIVFLRERGLAAAQKKSGRAASEGTVSTVIAPDNDYGYVFEVNCETDFVTRNEEFQKFVSTVQSIILDTKPTNLDALLATAYGNGHNIKDTLTSMIAKIGENMMIRRYLSLGNGSTFVTSYNHGNGKIGVLVEMAGDNIGSHRSNSTLNDVAKDVALQIAAMKPTHLNKESVTEETLKQEKAIYWEQYKNQGKPEAALPKIVNSRMETWFKESCLVDQEFVKDNSKTVGAYVKESGNKLGIANLTVKNFYRIELGEGVEKKSMDFATEVAEQMKSAGK